MSILVSCIANSLNKKSIGATSFKRVGLSQIVEITIRFAGTPEKL